VTIVRVGLAENKKFADGYEAIFGKKKAAQEKQHQAASKKPGAGRKSKSETKGPKTKKKSQKK